MDGHEGNARMGDTPTLIGIALPVCAGLIWLIRLEGKVNLHEALHKQMREDISYIRERIDKALNGERH